MVFIQVISSIFTVYRVRHPRPKLFYILIQGDRRMSLTFPCTPHPRRDPKIMKERERRKTKTDAGLSCPLGLGLAQKRPDGIPYPRLADILRIRGADTKLGHGPVLVPFPSRRQARHVARVVDEAPALRDGLEVGQGDESGARPGGEAHG